MNLVNAIWLCALFSLTIPIILHLQKRKIRTLDWAAVRFLKTSIVNRHSGLTLENFLLLFCRCLLLVSIVFLFARPWTKPGASVVLVAAWAILVISLAFGIASITWVGPRLYRILIGCTGCTLAIVSLAILVYHTESNAILRNNCCDAVIVIDGSDSMGLKNEKDLVEPSTLFSSAVREAQIYLDNLPAGSTAALLIVGAPDHSNLNHLKSNIPLLRKQLEALTLPGGANDLQNTIERARILLKEGTNPRQQILVITDDQRTNWQSLNLPEQDISNRNVSEEHRSNDNREPGLIAKVLNLPEKTMNLAATNIEMEDRTWRVGEKARVNIEILNGGTDPSESTKVDVQINDTLIQSISVDSLEPGTRRLIPAEIMWSHAGSSSLCMKLNSGDDLPGDNDFHRAFLIRNEIKTLIVNGEEIDSETRSAAHYLRLAMNGPMNITETIPLSDLDSNYPLDRFDVVCLSNVIRLDRVMSERLAKFIQNGGSLSVMLGENCDPDFYNNWKTESGRVMPLVLTSYFTKEHTNEDSEGLDWSSTQHPFLRPWLSSGQHDLSNWKFDSYWLTSTTEGHDLLTSQSKIDYLNGQTFFAEHGLGKGRVVAQTSSPSPRSNNLISRVSFPVWHHLLTHHLARSDSVSFHQKPSSAWFAQIPINFDGDSSPALITKSKSTAVLTDPMGKDKTVPIVREERFWAAELGKAKHPGLYKLSGPFGRSFHSETWRLSVERDANESDLTRATEEQINSVAKCLHMDLVIDDSHWLLTASGPPQKEEWWGLLAYVALALLVFESIVLRWLAQQRGQPVFPTTIAYLSLVGVTSWIVWWQGWTIVGRIVEIQYSNSMVGTAGLVASMSCIVAATYWDRTNEKSRGKLSLPLFVRLFELGIIGFVLLEPFKDQDKLNDDIGTIAVLWDRSKSMALKDSDVTREEIARKTLWGSEQKKSSLLNDISKSHSVQLYQYASNPRLVDIESMSDTDQFLTNETPELNSEWSDTTDISAALQRVLADIPKELLNGVVVISDGCDRSQLSPSKVASVFATQKVPIHAIMVGNRTPIADANVAAAHAPNQIYIKDQVTVSTTLHFDQLQGEKATVHFYREQVLLETRSIPIVSNQQRSTEQFTDIPKELGIHHYHIKIDPLSTDRIVANNQRELSVWVTNDRLNLLIVEQRPRWEFRYLKNLFAGRDKNVALQHVLLSPDRLAGVPDPFPMVASTSRAFDDCEANRLPETELEWLKFDVIVLGDIDPEELNEEAQRSIEKFVSQRGGTLVVISGPNSMPHRFVSAPLFNLLPIQKSSDKTKESTTPFRLRLTKDGSSSPLLNNLSSDTNPSQSLQNSVWNRLPKLYWHHPHSNAKAGATVLAWADDATGDDDEVTPDNRDANESQNQKALILWHRYGGGKVLQLNFDQTWRMRYWNGDELHHKFWGRVVRWGTEDRLGLGTELVRLGLDKARYKTQESMTAKVRLVEEESSENVNAETVRCVLTRDGETISDAPLQQRHDSGGLLEAGFTLPKTPGRYRIHVMGPRVDRLLAAENKTGHTVFAEFYVENSPADDESNDLVANATVLASLTNLTGGQLLDAQSIHGLSETFSKETNQSLDQITEPVWDYWPIGSLFLTLILGEWILRKRCGFI